MREYTVQVRFTQPSLGNQKDPTTGRFKFQRSGGGKILYLASWHKSNMAFAAKIHGKKTEDVDKILWDIEVDAELRSGCLTRSYYTKSGKSKNSAWSTHESLLVGQLMGINCVLPDTVSVDDFWSLMATAGKYKGLSPWKPGKFGQYSVESINPRRPAVESQ